MASDLLDRVEARAARVAGAAAGEDFSEYSDDPVRFAIEVLGFGPWSRQAEILRALVDHHRVAVRSGHKIGKSTAAAAAALWWVCTRAGARVVFSAPTSRQVRSILWRELRRLYLGAKRPIGGELHDTPDRGLQLPDGREVIGFSTDTPERISGLSGPAMLYVIDEASGVTEDLFAALQGNLAGGGAVLLLSNPTKTSGTFFDAFNAKAKFWHPLHVSSLESPNLTGDGDVVPGLATQAWADEMLEEWSEQSPLYQCRVLGNFPTQVENAIISLELIDAAVARGRELRALSLDKQAELGPLEVGIDPARFGGDESVWCARRGPLLYGPFVARNLDGPALAERVMQTVIDLRRGDEKALVRIDAIGVGSSPLDFLSRNSSITVLPINVSESATDAAKYMRKRDEVWFGIKDWLKAGGGLPDDPKLSGELVAPTYSISPNGKIQVESKDDMRKRLKRSPDRADALGLTVFAVARQITSAQLWGRPGAIGRFMGALTPNADTRERVEAIMYGGRVHHARNWHRG